MALKFDGKYLKDGGKTLCYVEGNYIKEGFHTGKTLCGGCEERNGEGDQVKAEKRL